jgi:hypothetical protein
VREVSLITLCVNRVCKNGDNNPAANVKYDGKVPHMPFTVGRGSCKHHVRFSDNAVASVVVAGPRKE